MSIDFTHDYANHSLLENKNRYTELYKLDSSSASDIHKGDLVLLKTACGKYGIFIASSDPDPDETLHLSPYSGVDFIKMSE